MGAFWTQLYPPRPTFTEKELPSLTGKVFIVTGGNAGVGLELTKILYSRGGTVYVASRNLSKVEEEISKIRHTVSTPTPGDLKALRVDLSDLTTIQPCVTEFLSQSTRLDVLFNNAGISQCPPGSTSTQGHEAHMGTNCLGPFLLTTLLLPVLTSTAQSLPSSSTPSVRVIFTSSQAAEAVSTPTHPGGLDLSTQTPGNFSRDKNRNYGASKAGNWFLAAEFDRRARARGVTCLTQNPGMLRTKGWDRLPWLVRTLAALFLHEPRMGAYTELWAGLSPDVTREDGGRYAIPWGRWHPDPPVEFGEAMRTKAEGGTGLAAEFYEWCAEQTKGYVKA